MKVFYIVAVIIILFIWIYVFPPHIGKEGLQQMNNQIKTLLLERAKDNINKYVYCASYNSAYDGSKISVDAVTNVLTTGCRVLDFEIYSISPEPSSTGIAVVGYTTDPKYSSLISGNTVPFATICNTIINNAFSTITCHNSTDPLFIQLRIKTNCSASSTISCDVYSQVASILQTKFGNRIIANIDPTTITMEELMGKIIIIIDRSLNPDYKNYSTDSLSDLIGLESGGADINTYLYSSIATNTNTSNSLIMCVPDDYSKQYISTNPVSVYPYIVNNRCNIPFYKFYESGTELDSYMDLFTTYSTAFVPIDLAISQAQSMDI